MQPSIEQTIECVEQLYATITGARPQSSDRVAPFPPEVDPYTFVEQQAARMCDAAKQVDPGTLVRAAAWQSSQQRRTQMDTVKVDIQKLQLLNDRIAQTIEALNQLRLSVHGVQHTPATIPSYGVSSYGVSPYGGFTPSPFGMPQSYAPFATAFSPYGQPYAQPFGYSGIQHSAFIPQTFGSPSFIPQTFGSPTSAFIPQTFGAPTPAFVPSVSVPSNGISHSTWEPTTQWTSQWPTTQWTGQWPTSQWPTTQWATRTPWTVTPYTTW